MNLYYPWDSKRLVEHCEKKVKDPRALFHAPMIAQMIVYAGYPERFKDPENWAKRGEYHSISKDMEELVILAREKLGISRKNKPQF